MLHPLPLTAAPLLDRLKILAGSARYDVSCTSSGSRRRAVSGGVGAGSPAGVCHSWSADGRCVSLLKVLFTNVCIFDCAYCANRRSNDIPRAMFTPTELADLTIGFYRRNCIEGLFLSSGVFRSPDETMDLLLRTVRLLRETHGFGGYIHLKAIPGADPRLLRQAGAMVDRLSVNIELPSERSLLTLAPEKNRATIFQPMSYIRDRHLESRRPDCHGWPRAAFAPAGQSTQLIVGASPEDDRQILTLASNLYKTMGLRRVFYSAYVPVNHDRRLPDLAMPPLLREHRLYQADWLVRFYRFEAGELFAEGAPRLDAEFDPKVAWALRHLERFPVEVNTADQELLLRVPGLGLRSAERILRARRAGRLTLEDLPRLGVVWKRARFFLTASGAFGGGVAADPESIRRRLRGEWSGRPRQLSFEDLPSAPRWGEGTRAPALSASDGDPDPCRSRGESARHEGRCRTSDEAGGRAVAGPPEPEGAPAIPVGSALRGADDVSTVEDFAAAVTGEF